MVEDLPQYYSPCRSATFCVTSAILFRCRMLTKEEGNEFIENVLAVESAEERLRNDRLGLLNDIIAKMQSVIPAHSVTILEKPPQERCLPSLETMKEACFTKVGGSCYIINGFLFYLLKALGYCVFFNVSREHPYDRNNHILLLVKNVLCNDDLYLVDAACFFPSFGAVCMNFQSETGTFRHSFNEHKFTKSGNTIYRLHSRPNSYEMPHSPRNFKVFYEFTINPTADIHQIAPYMEAVYKDPTVTPFHLSYRALRFWEDGFLIIVNYKVLLGSNGTPMRTILLKNDAELLEATRKYFPEIDEMVAKRAIENFKKVYKK